MIDIDKAIERGIKKAHQLGASEIEIYVVEEDTALANATQKGLEGIRRGITVSADVRVAIGKRVTVQGAIISSEEDLFNLIEKAMAIVKSVPEDINWVTLPRSYSFTPTYDIVDDRVRSCDIEFFTQLIDEVSNMPKELDKRAYASYIVIETSLIRKWISNSYVSTPASYEKTSFLFSLTVNAVENGYESSYHGYYLAPTLKEFDLKTLTEKTTSIAISTLRSRPIETGKYNVVFTPPVFASIIQILLVPAVRADQVQRNRSPLAKKLFSKVLSEDITMIDDGAAPNMIRSAPFDDEGVQTKRKTVIDKGVLMTYLYDTYTAYIDNQESTGNAIRPGIGLPPIPNATNIIIIPGLQSIDTIIRDVGDALVIYATIGEWLSNPVNGNLGATVTNAIYYKNGEPVQGVKGVTISGNIYNLLGENLIAISREVELVGNTLTPSVCVKEAIVAGK